MSNPQQVFTFSKALNSSLIFGSNQQILTNDSFSNYVYSLIKKRNPDKTVLKSSIHIVIQDKSHNESLFLYPRITKIESSPEQDASDDIDFALSLLENKECKHIYLVFPKTQTFRRQVSVKSKKLDDMGLDYTLKLIPYKMDQKSCKSCKTKERL